MEDVRLHVKPHPTITVTKDTSLWLDILIKKKQKKPPSYNHVSAIEKNFYILIFTAFSEFDKYLKQSGS